MISYDELTLIMLTIALMTAGLFAAGALLLLALRPARFRYRKH